MKCDGCGRWLDPRSEGQWVQGFGYVIGCVCGTLNLIKREVR